MLDNLIENVKSKCPFCYQTDRAGNLYIRKIPNVLLNLKWEAAIYTWIKVAQAALLK